MVETAVSVVSQN